jgi:hypothetical protein
MKHAFSLLPALVVIVFPFVAVQAWARCAGSSAPPMPHAWRPSARWSTSHRSVIDELQENPPPENHREYLRLKLRHATKASPANAQKTTLSDDRSHGDGRARQLIPRQEVRPSPNPQYFCLSHGRGKYTTMKHRQIRQQTWQYLYG